MLASYARGTGRRLRKGQRVETLWCAVKQARIEIEHPTVGCRDPDNAMTPVKSLFLYDPLIGSLIALSWIARIMTPLPPTGIPLITRINMPAPPSI